MSIKDDIKYLNEQKRAVMIKHDKVPVFKYQDIISAFDAEITEKTAQLLEEQKPDPTTEILAEILHNRWVEWSRGVAEVESLSKIVISKWTGKWVAYDELADYVKKEYRKNAEKFVNLDVSIDSKLLIMKVKERKKKRGRPKKK